MNRYITLERHGVSASLLPLAPKYWRIFIDGGRGGQFEHAGSRESAEHRAGWECWCYKRVSDERAQPCEAAQSPDLLAAFFDTPPSLSTCKTAG